MYAYYTSEDKDNNVRNFGTTFGRILDERNTE
jgi:hypothetical protein